MMKSSIKTNENIRIYILLYLFTFIILLHYYFVILLNNSVY